LRELLGRHGLTVESDRDLADVAASFDRRLGSKQSLRSGRVAVAITRRDQRL
jgi:hypothetical protein